MRTRFNILIAGLALWAGLGTATAQNIDYATETGRVAAGPLFDAGRRLLFSQHDYTFGTSRSAAMGGAFTSLGADLSSMSINPAGLGMYQSSDWGFTQALSIDGMYATSRNMSAGSLTAGGNRVSYGLNNIGAAWNFYNGSGKLTSLTFGFAYNRAANFNSKTWLDTRGERSSIGDMFARQLNYYGITENQIQSSSRPFEVLDPEWFGAILGYRTDLVGINDDGGFGAWLDAVPNDSYFSSEARGGIYEYDFSMGANISNFLYLGATVGWTEINYTEDTTYEERYGPGQNSGILIYNQSNRISGNGVTAKLGLVVRPVEPLRIGVAFHLPTWYTLDKSYSGSMDTRDYFDNSGLVMSSHRFSTAPKLLAGISGVIGKHAIVAVDWEMAWYDLIRKRGVDAIELENSKSEARSLYKPAHTLRAGLEYLLTSSISLRAGGAYMMDFMRDDFVVNNPTARNGFSITGGVGFKIGRNGYLDVAYVYNRSRQTDYDFYYFNEPGDGPDWTAQFDTVGDREYRRSYTPTRQRHMITLTLGNRF